MSDVAPGGDPRGRISVRPSAYGAGLVAVVAGVALFRPGVADPFLGSTVWVAAAAAALIGVLGPLLVVTTVGVEVDGRLLDVDVGTTQEVGLRVRGPRSTVELAWGDRGSGWYRLPASGPVTAPWAATRRAVLDHLPISVRSGGPLGLVVVTRHLQVALPHPIHVGPAPLDAARSVPEPGRLGGGEPSGSPSHQGELVRGVRPYQVGDPAHLVHWPSTARVGHPMVRELERPARVGLVVVVVLDPAHPTAARELAASRAAGVVIAALRSGVAVHLCTVEDAGPRSAEVATRDELRRRLARTVPGPPVSQGPAGWPVEWVRSDPTEVAA